MSSRLNVAVIGAGYWGPNLARNFRASSDWNLAAICDLDTASARSASRTASAESPVTPSLDDVLADPSIDAIAVATPARTHHPIVLAALEAGKHVIVEKPLADDRVERGVEMVETARERGLVLMADHTYCYTPAVLKIRELIADGFLGDILFVDSVRINLGLIQPDVDVFWDLAPHDLSIMDFVLPGGLDVDVGLGSRCRSAPHRQVVHRLPRDAAVERRDRARARQLAQPDEDPADGHRRHASAHSCGTTSTRSSGSACTTAESTWHCSPRRLPTTRAANISYRLGDTWAPALPEREALAGVATEFAASIRERREARTSGDSGLRVLSVLEAATASLGASGAPQPVDAFDELGRQPP